MGYVQGSSKALIFYIHRGCSLNIHQINAIVGNWKQEAQQKCNKNE